MDATKSIDELVREGYLLQTIFKARNWVWPDFFENAYTTGRIEDLIKEGYTYPKAVDITIAGYGVQDPFVGDARNLPEYPLYAQDIVPPTWGEPITNGNFYPDTNGQGQPTNGQGQPTKEDKIIRSLPRTLFLAGMILVGLYTLGVWGYENDVRESETQRPLPSASIV